MMGDVLLVAGREVREKLRDRAFLLFTAFMLLLPFVVGAAGAASIGGAPAGPPEYAVGLVGEGAEEFGRLLEAQAPTFDVEISPERLPDRSAAEEALAGGEIDAAVLGAERIVSSGRPAYDLETLLQSSAQRLSASEALRAAGVPAAEVEAAVGDVPDPAPLAVEAVGGESGSGGGWLLASASAVLLSVTVFTYGYWIANGVVEEKSSRVVEVVLSAVRPSRLLAGKVLGIGLLGLGQLALVAAVVVGPVSLLGLGLPSGTLGAAGMVLLWFLLGFAFYGCLFAVAGSLVSRQEDLQYTQLPIMVLLFVGYGAAFFLLGDPASPAARALSFLPPFAPMLMPARASLGEAGAWEVCLAALLTVAASAGLLALAARLYAGSALRFGARVPLREAWRGSGSR